MKKKICHITTVHSRYDVRIFHKQCRSLSKHYSVYLVVADGLGNESRDDIQIFDIGLRQSSRIKRVKTDSKKALKKAIDLDCDLYHFHDPELTQIGIKLKRIDKKVVYDTHEDLPRQIMGKPYINKFIRPVLSKIIEWIENSAAKRFDYISCATPFIRDRFLKLNSNTVDINNYPIIGELHSLGTKKINGFCYTGGITEERGIINIVSALKNTSTTLFLAGPVENNNYLNQIKNLPEWEKVNYFGVVDRNKLGEIMSQSIAGLVTFLPLPNHINAQPNKIFEYMSSGIPVIGSNFELWKNIIEKNNCGICVDPLQPETITKAFKYLINNPDKAIQMGKNGQNAVQQKYNWSIEEEKLLKMYHNILG